MHQVNVDCIPGDTGSSPTRLNESFPIVSEDFFQINQLIPLCFNRTSIFYLSIQQPRYLLILQQQQQQQ